jgi:radical SAM superfamily enzyme YgiQ (UPF0313 family)
MKILLVNPESLGAKHYTILPNIGLGYLASSLQSRGHSVEILDCVLDRKIQRNFINYVLQNAPDIIGFSVFTRTFASAKKYIKEIKNNNRNCILLAGGPHGIFEPEETLDYLGVDYVFSGEAEESLPALVDLIQKKFRPASENLAKIMNLVWKNDEGRVIVNPRSYVDVNSNPIPAWELIRPERYPAAPNGIFSRARKIAPIIITRGCPYPCTFCGAGIASGKKLRKRNIDNVIEEIKLLKGKFGIEEIHIMDDNFTLDMDYAKEVCRTIIKENIKLYFACPNGIRLDRIDEELLKLMEKAGFYSFAVGIESGSQKTLDYMKKELTLDEIKDKIELIKSVSKIEVTGFFILGYPDEKVEDIEKTISFALKLPIDKANFFNFTPFPGSAEYLRLKSEGKLKNIDYSKLYIHEISYTPENITKRRFKWLQIKAHVLFYCRLRILKKLLPEIRSVSQLLVIFKRLRDILF